MIINYAISPINRFSTVVIILSDKDLDLIISGESVYKMLLDNLQPIGEVTVVREENKE